MVPALKALEWTSEVKENAQIVLFAFRYHTCQLYRGPSVPEIMILYLQLRAYGLVILYMCKKVSEFYVKLYQNFI